MSASQENGYTTDWLRHVLGNRPTVAPPPNSPVTGAYEPRKVGAGDGDTYVGYAQPAVQAPLQDHEVAQVVNELRRLALEFGGSQQLRERIASYIVPILRGEKRP